MEVLSEFTCWLLVEILYDPIRSRFGPVAALIGTASIILALIFGAFWFALRFVGV